MLYLPLLCIFLKDAESWKRLKKGPQKLFGRWIKTLILQDLELIKRRICVEGIYILYKVRDAKCQRRLQSIRGRHLKNWCSEEATR